MATEFLSNANDNTHVEAAGTPMTITQVSDRYDCKVTYKDIANEAERRVRERARRRQGMVQKINDTRSLLSRKYWRSDRVISSLKDGITRKTIRRENITEVCLEIATAQATERHLPGVMRRKIQIGELPPILALQSARDILNHRPRIKIARGSFVGSFFVPGKPTKMTGWDRVNQGMSQTNY